MPDSQTFQAATTILARETDGLEVLMVKRHHQIDFVAGAMVFPGGKTHEDDRNPEWAKHVNHWHDVPVVEQAPRIAAIRECFEECGVIIGDPGLAEPGPDMVRARQAIERREILFLDYVRDNKIVLDLSSLTLFARWLTPPIVPKRFDTFFYLVADPGGQNAISDGRETVGIEWIAPQEALRLAELGEREIVFPTRMNLMLLAQSENVLQASKAAASRVPRIVTPSVVTRGKDRFLRLHRDDGYGDCEELLHLP